METRHHTKSVTHFKVEGIKKLMEDTIKPSEDFPACLSSDDLVNPLEVVVILNPDLAIAIANILVHLQINSVFECLYRVLLRHAQPQKYANPFVFFRAATVETFINILDEQNEEFYKQFLRPAEVRPSLEIVLTMTRKFTQALVRVLKKQVACAPAVMSFCDELEKIVFELESC